MRNWCGVKPNSASNWRIKCDGEISTSRAMASIERGNSGSSRRISRASHRRRNMWFRSNIAKNVGRQPQRHRDARGFGLGSPKKYSVRLCASASLWLTIESLPFGLRAGTAVGRRCRMHQALHRQRHRVRTQQHRHRVDERTLPRVVPGSVRGCGEAGRRDVGHDLVQPHQRSVGRRQRRDDRQGAPRRVGFRRPHGERLVRPALHGGGSDRRL